MSERAYLRKRAKFSLWPLQVCFSTLKLSPALRNERWRYFPRSFYPIASVSDILMPTILRLDGLRVVVYPNDHAPAHVHVLGPGAEAVFELGCPDGPVTLRESHSFSTRQLRSVSESLNEALQVLCDEWWQIHEAD